MDKVKKIILNLSLCSSFTVRDEVSFPYKTTRISICFHAELEKTKGSELNDSKHFQNLICSWFPHEHSSDLLLWFSNIWTLPHPTFSLLYFIQLPHSPWYSYTVVYSTDFVFKFPKRILLSTMHSTWLSHCILNFSNFCCNALTLRTRLISWFLMWYPLTVSEKSDSLCVQTLLIARAVFILFICRESGDFTWLPIRA
jgi:hypothetical protein